MLRGGLSYLLLRLNTGTGKPTFSKMGSAGMGKVVEFSMLRHTTYCGIVGMDR